MNQLDRPSETFDEFWGGIRNIRELFPRPFRWLMPVDAFRPLAETVWKAASKNSEAVEEEARRYYVLLVFADEVISAYPDVRTNEYLDASTKEEVFEYCQRTLYAF